MYRRNYTVNGVNPKTGRLNKRSYKAFNEVECYRIAFEKDGLVEPFEILNIYDDSPSENQLSYASHLGITIPKKITFQELSELISFKVENDTPATESLKRYASQIMVEYSDNIGERNLANKIIDALYSEPDKQIAFYLFVVYNIVTGNSIISIEDSQNKPAFKDFGEEMAVDKKFVASFSNELGYGKDSSFSILFSQEYTNHFADSRAYSIEKSKHYLRYKFQIDRWRKREINDRKPLDEMNTYSSAAPNYAVKQLNSKQSQPKGCAQFVLIFIILTAIGLFIF